MLGPLLFPLYTITNHPFSTQTEDASFLYQPDSNNFQNSISDVFAGLNKWFQANNPH
jgi:hypothetical protein